MIEKLKKIKSDIISMSYQDNIVLDRIRGKIKLIIRREFGEKSDYFKDIKVISFYGLGSNNSKYWHEGKGKLTNLVDLIIDDIKLSQNSAITPKNIEIEEEVSKSNKVFIVHGHDEEIKQAVARFVEVLGLEAIILHEKPNDGKTIIEKFEKHANVQFAIVLFTPDDKAYSVNEPPENVKFRSRQNVVLELGYFIGKLSRKNVMVIFRDTENFDIPSDYSGVLYTPFDDKESWKLSLCRELNSAGFTVDTTKLL